MADPIEPMVTDEVVVPPPPIEHKADVEEADADAGDDMSAAENDDAKESAEDGANPTGKESVKNKNKRKREFLETHALQYGVKVVEHDPTTGKVSKVSCRFCIHFGREYQNPTDESKKKRRKTENIKFFCKPFRTDKYNSHLESEHKAKWELYKNLSSDEKATFFDYPASRAVGIVYDNLSAPAISNTRSILAPDTVAGENLAVDAGAATHATTTILVSDGGQQALRFLINTNIVDLLIKGMLNDGSFEGTGTDSEASAESVDRVSSMFQLVQVVPSRHTPDGTIMTSVSYETTVPNRQQFLLAIMQLANGLSFAQVSQSIQDTKAILGLEKLTFVNNGHSGGGNEDTRNDSNMEGEATATDVPATNGSKAGETVGSSVHVIGNTNDRLIQRYARICCAHNYQQLHRILTASCWGFSIYLNVYKTLTTVPFADVRVTAFALGRLHNCHVCALPLGGSSTPKHLYDTFATFMDVIEPKWRQKVIGLKSSLSSKIDNTIDDIQRILCGLMTHVASECDSSFFREWCGVTQLEEQVFHKFYCGILASDPEDRNPATGKLCGKWYKDFVAISTYLRGETELCQTLGGLFPVLPAESGDAAAAWSCSSSMPRAISWLEHKKVALRDHFKTSGSKASDKAKQKPTVGDVFWLILSLVNDVAESAAQAFQSLLQSKNLPTALKIQHLEILSKDLKGKFKIESIDSLADDDTNDMGHEDGEQRAGTVKVKSYKLRVSKILEYWEEQSTFAQGLVGKQNRQFWTSTSIHLGQLILNMVQDLDGLIEDSKAESDSIYVATENNGQVQTEGQWQPTKIAYVSGQDFSELVHKYRRRLEAKYSSISSPDAATKEIVDAIKKDHRDLREAYRLQPRFKAALEEVDSKDIAKFSQTWAPISDRFRDLFAFIGTLATTQAGQFSKDESISLFQWTQDQSKKKLMTDFSLESKIHAQQWKELNSIGVNMATKPETTSDPNTALDVASEANTSTKEIIAEVTKEIAAEVTKEVVAEAEIKMEVPPAMPDTVMDSEAAVAV